MKKVLIILLILPITIVAYAAFTGAGVRFTRPLHPQVNTVGLIAHYKMWDGLMTDGEIFDYTCNGNGGSLQDTDDPITLIPTYPGFYFDGVEDYITIADDTSFSPGGTDLITNGDFGAWVADDPTGWTEYNEAGVDPMVNEVGAGQGHGGAGAGYCNIYTSVGAVAIDLSQDLTAVIGQEYRVRLNINLVVDGGIVVSEARHTMWVDIEYSTTGVKTFTFVATHTNPSFLIGRAGVASCDVTFDNVSVTPVMPFSISAWINMVDATEFIIATKGVYNTDGEWRFATETNDKLYALFFDESVADCYIGRIYNTALTQNEWLHVVMTWDGGIVSATSVNLYLDSVDVDNADQENNATSFVAVENDLGHAVHLNRDFNTYGDGRIDDIMFFDKELTAIEVRNIYEVTRWRYSK